MNTRDENTHPVSDECLAVVCNAHGPFQNMVVAPIKVPKPKTDEVLITVKASGVSFANILAVAGKHQNKSTPPFAPGTEVSGIVLATGPDVIGLEPDDRVMAAMSNGGFSQIACARADLTYKIPETMSFEEATTLPTIYGTACAGLMLEARLQEGETLLVHGAAGATGYAAVQIGRAMGARVIACASTDEKRALALKGGAEFAVGPEEFRDQTLELTQGRGADVIFDTVGGVAFEQSVRAIAPRGRLLSIGFASGTIPSVAVNHILVKNISVIGLNWGYYLGWARAKTDAKTQADRDYCFQKLMKLFDEKKIAPVIQKAFPMKEFIDALELIDHRGGMGKIVLLP